MLENHGGSIGWASVARLFFFIGSVGFAPSPALAAGEGVPVNGQPSYQERAVLTLTNAVRLAPSQYRDTYLPSGNGGILNGSAVAPVYWNAALNLAARNHAVDMADHNYFSHTSLDGRTWLQRIAQAGYTGSATGENIAAGQPTPLSVMQAWLLSTGHRDNIMRSGSKELGCGYAYNGSSAYRHYWVQDFGTRSFTVQSPIVCGAHVIPTTGSIRFLVDVYDPAAQPSAPQSVTLVLAGASQSMNLHMGSAARGVYEKTLSTASSCRAYHFEVRSASGALWRYPASGEFLTSGEGNCTQNYQAASVAVPGDVNGDGVVNVNDLLAVIAAWGPCPAPPTSCPCDVAPAGAGNGMVNVDDLLLIINRWG